MTSAYFLLKNSDYNVILLEANSGLGIYCYLLIIKKYDK